MKAWAVADLRWATAADAGLPLWAAWKRRNRGERSWRRAWEHPYVASRVPREAAVLEECDGDAGARYLSGVGLDEHPDAAASLRRAVGLARHRVVATIAVGGAGAADAAALEELLGQTLPPVPDDALTPDGATHLLGLTVDARDEPRSAAILVPHWESWDFLELAVDAITEHASPEVDHRVYVLDDSSRDGSFERAESEYAGRDDVRVLRIERPNKDREADVGLLLDLGLREVEEQYVATIDADLFALDRAWLSFPIWLIEQLGLSMAGLDTGLSTPYVGYHPKRSYRQPAGGYLTAAGTYDNDWFVCINNLYRVMPTALAKVTSEHVGFSRSSTARERLHERIRQRASAALPGDWLDRRHPYIRGQADNGVAANHFVDVNRLGPKFNIPITGFVGLTPRDGAFGQNIAGLAFHFALSTRALSGDRREVADAGSEFARWAERLNRAGGPTGAVIAEMVAASSEPRAGGYDGSIPASWYQEQLDRIADLRRRHESGASAEPLGQDPGDPGAGLAVAEDRVDPGPRM